MVDAVAQTEPALSANVIGVEQDALIGVRVRMSFGSRAFWGTVVNCYWVSGGLFYKVSFDDGDVDILSADEVVRDAEAAKTHAKENPQHKERDKKPNDSTPPVEGYFQSMRQHSLKRKRDDVVNSFVTNVRTVHLWGQRLYASIYTNEKNETFIRELLRTEDGQVGEMEATGQVKVGDMILAVNQTRVLGIPSRDLAEIIRKPKRPVKLVLYRPRHLQLPIELLQMGQTQPPPPAPTITTTPTQHSTNQVALPSQPLSARAPTVTPLSFVVPHQTLAHARPVAQALDQRWTQSSQHLSNMEYIRQRVSQNVQARQAGYPNGVHVPITIGANQAHPHQFIHNFANTAAPGLSVSDMRPTKPMYEPLATAAQVAYNSMLGDQQRGMSSIHYGTVQQSQSSRNLVTAAREVFQEPTQFFQNKMVDSSRSEAQERRFTAVSQNETSALSRQPYSQASKSGQSSVDSTLEENTRRLMFSSQTPGPSILTKFDTDLKRKSSERGPKATQLFIKKASTTTSLPPSTGTQETKDALGTLSFLPPNTADKSIGRDSAGASQAMSFLSPNVEFDASSLPSANHFEDVESIVNLVTVKVSRSRLYLTLGVQGTLIAVTSFVLDEFGKPGEVEKSGKVFIGDVLVRVNHIHIFSGMMPNNVAEIVNSVPRPIILGFKRASWEILDGKA